MSGAVGPFLDGGGSGPPSNTPGGDLSITNPQSLPLPPIPPNVASVASPTDGVPQTGQPLWIRRWSLTIGPAGGEPNAARDLSQFSFEFEVNMQQNATAWLARVKVWNPPPDLVGKVGKEYTNVLLKAGYMAPSKQYGTVAQGQINYYHYGRQSETDTYLEVFMAMHDTAYTAAVVNTWVPAGSTTDVVIDQLLIALAPYGVTRSQITQMSQEKSPRGRAIVGMVRDVARDIAQSEDAKWFIDTDGKFHVLRQDEILALGSESVPILSTKTGLIGWPTQTLGNGVAIQSLLNPAIHPGKKIKVEADINRRVAGPGTELIETQFKAQEPLTAAISTDGYYTVGKVTHSGQNRGNAWYSHIVTQAFANQKPSILTSAG
jgi:hypothetical protein